MKYWGLVFVAMGLLQGFITYRNKNKVSIYIRYREIEVIEAEKYFKLQMKYGLVGSTVVLVGGVIFYIGYDIFEKVLVLVPVLSTIFFNLCYYMLYRVALAKKWIRKE